MKRVLTIAIGGALALALRDAAFIALKAMVIRSARTAHPEDYGSNVAAELIYLIESEGESK